MNAVVVRYSEIALKGKNRKEFEKKLVQNIKSSLKKQKKEFKSIERKYSRIIINTDKKPDLSNVFGISSFSPAVLTEPDFEEIKKAITPLIKYYKKSTSFRISAKRIDKDFPINSMGIEREIGSFVVEKTGAKVDLKNYKKEIGIEMLKGEAVIFEKKIKGAGGLPVGVEGKVVALIDDEKSLDAARLVMKRGCGIIPFGFKDRENDISSLNKHSPTELKFEKIKCFKDMEKIAKACGAKALVVGQTLKNFQEIKTKLLVLRPMIAK